MKLLKFIQDGAVENWGFHGPDKDQRRPHSKSFVVVLLFGEFDCLECLLLRLPFPSLLCVSNLSALKSFLFSSLVHSCQVPTIFLGVRLCVCSFVCACARMVLFFGSAYRMGFRSDGSFFSFSLVMILSNTVRVWCTCL